jgi:glutamate synthase domain-containing protein 3
MRARERNGFIEEVSPLNRQIVEDCREGRNGKVGSSYAIAPRDRAAAATLQGLVARERWSARREGKALPEPAKLRLEFTGSAGHGFAAFLQYGFDVRRVGAAHDSVAKSMSGGRVVVVPSENAALTPESSTILGNSALYGATGGTLYAHGMAGNRFAVRNSGAVAVVEAVGMHACEYMTRGLVVILGGAGANIGAGMTGGVLYLTAETARQLNTQYLKQEPLTAEDEIRLRGTLKAYHAETGSRAATRLLSEWPFVKAVPLSAATPPESSR